MFMDSELQKIAEDILREDPTLQISREEIFLVLKRIEESKPVSHASPDFMGQLRAEIIEKIAVGAHAPQKYISLTSPTTFMRRLNFVFGGIAAIALLIAGGLYYGTSIFQVKPSITLGSDIKIEKVAAGSFGKLAIQATAGELRDQSGGGAAPAAGTEQSSPLTSAQAPLSYGMGGGVGGGGPGSAPDVKIMPPYYPSQIVYTYKGEPLSLPADQLDVLRRVKGSGTTGDTIELLNQINFGLLDLRSFDTTELQNYSFAENKPYGYSIFVNLLEGDISISQNWLRWPNPYANCLDQVCYDALQLSLSDMPSDDEIIAIANQFLSDHGIDRSHYGDPGVQSDWKIYYEQQAATGLRPWVPDTISVLYPLLIDGKTVYDEGGSPSGLSVAVQVKEKKVTSVYQLQSQNYQSSLYDVEKDTKRLLKLAERGGRWGTPVYPPDQQVQTIPVDLKTPSLEWVRVWNYKDNQSDELVVPALIFPVTNPPTTEYYVPKNIVAPLIKDVLDSWDTPIEIMPAAGGPTLRVAQ